MGSGFLAELRAPLSKHALRTVEVVAVDVRQLVGQPAKEIDRLDGGGQRPVLFSQFRAPDAQIEQRHTEVCLELGRSARGQPAVYIHRFDGGCQCVPSPSQSRQPIAEVDEPGLSGTRCAGTERR
jgi:hypothetical protein